MVAATTTRRRPITVQTATGPQVAFWGSPERFRAFVGGIGSGKTYAGTVEILRQPAGSTGMVVAPTYPMLRDATLRTFADLARPLLAEFNRSEMRATLTNGTRVLFRSADDPDRLRGPNLGWFWLDEAALMDAETWLVMIGRLRERPGRAWVTSTPRGHNWLHATFTQGGADYHVTRSSSRDNTFLPASFVQSLEHAYDARWLAQEVDGEFIDFNDIDAFLPDIALWDACYDDALPPLDAHTPVILALDAGESSDTFATVLLSQHPTRPGVVAARYARAYVPQGGPLDFDAIERDLRDLGARYAVSAVVYDPMLLGQMVRRLKLRTATHPPFPAPFHPFPQGAARLEGDKGLYDLVTQRRLAHDGNPDLRAHVGNANKRIDADGRKLRIVKREHAKKIDLCVALAMGAARADLLGLPRGAALVDL